MFYDLTNVGWSHLLEFNPSYIKKCLSIIQEAMPARLKGINVYKPPKFFETFVNIAKAFLSAKNKKRVGPSKICRINCDLTQIFLGNGSWQ